MLFKMVFVTTCFLLYFQCPWSCLFFIQGSMQTAPKRRRRDSWRSTRAAISPAWRLDFSDTQSFLDAWVPWFQLNHWLFHPTFFGSHWESAELEFVHWDWLSVIICASQEWSLAGWKRAGTRLVSESEGRRGLASDVSTYCHYARWMLL